MDRGLAGIGAGRQGRRTGGGGAHFLCERVFMLRTVECRAEVGLGHRPSSGGRGRPNSGGRTGAPGP